MDLKLKQSTVKDFQGPGDSNIQDFKAPTPFSGTFKAGNPVQTLNEYCRPSICTAVQ